ncbi:hypothetical protein SNEBB_010120 [Seison nebaliae]|nr:hypothetical protein SNEBB_010120 [Seison nebaliae]
MKKNGKIAILDAGAQYRGMIERRIREEHVNYDVFPLETKLEKLKEYCGIVISGGPGSVNDKIEVDKSLFEENIPILGICFGHQLLAKMSGGEVTSELSRDDGQRSILIDNENELFKNIPTKEIDVLLTHSDSVRSINEKLFERIDVVSTRSMEKVLAMKHLHLPHYGLQFHPESQLTTVGNKIFNNFLISICHCNASDFDEKINIDGLCEEIRQEYQTILPKPKKVLVLLSGGVDSTVTCAILSKALGKENIMAVHIDHGFMRHNESELVMKSLRELDFCEKIDHLKCMNFFLQSKFVDKNFETENGYNVTMETEMLCNTIDPEHKRNIIGDVFIQYIFNYLAKNNLMLSDIILAQGTLRPDLIESASILATTNEKTSKIKTHHNDSQLVRELRKKNRVIEPLKNLHKDEVRELGKSLKLPLDLVNRHPFPGPGLAIRILCAQQPFIEKDVFFKTSERLRKIAEFWEFRIKWPKLVEEFVGKLNESEIDFLSKLYDEKSNESIYLTTLLPIRTVGVQGDERTYSYVAVLSHNNKNREEIDWYELMNLAKIICRICSRINRVTFLFGSRSDAMSVKYVIPTTLKPEIINLARECDRVATGELFADGWKSCGDIAQMPVVLLPINIMQPVTEELIGGRTVAIRPLVTKDFMTGIAAQPGVHVPAKTIKNIFEKLKNVPGISNVLYDLTNKPPGTTEWE